MVILKQTSQVIMYQKKIHITLALFVFCHFVIGHITLDSVLKIGKKIIHKII